MNAPYPPFLRPVGGRDIDTAPVEVSTVRPEAVQLSSRALGWRAINIERREEVPGSHSLPGGTTEHLIFVSLAEGHCVREGADDIADSAIETGHVSIHPAFRPAKWAWDTRLLFSALALDPDFLSQLAAEVFGLRASEAELRVVEGQRDPVITHIAGMLSREVLTGDAGSKLLAESLANQLAIHLLRNYTVQPIKRNARTGTSAPKAVNAAIEHINAYYAREISLSEIADAVHVSPFHLARLFKKATGSTLHQYLIEVRLNSARALLTAGAGARSLAEIASAVGFADQSHLTRHFKRAFGLTPRQIRQ